MAAPAWARSGIPQNKIVSGSRVHLQLKGAPVGEATIASYAEAYGQEPVAVLDQPEIAEHVLISYDVSFTASRVYIAKRSLKDLNLSPKWPDGSQSDQLLLNALTLGEMSAEIVDQTEGVLATIQGVKVVSHNLTFGARAVTGEDVAFVAIRVIDAIEGP